MRFAASVLAGCSLSLAACATSPTVPPAPGAGDIELPADFSAGYRPPPGTDEDWWKGFRDDRLDELIELALTENLGIAATRERLEASRAALRAERSDLLPSLDGGASAGIDADADGTADRLSIGVSGFFDPDLSGRLSAEIEAAAASAAAAKYLVADRRRIVAAEVARQYIELRRTGERLKLLDQSTELQERTLRTVTLRFEAGLAANLDVRRAAADLARTRAQRGLLELQRSQAAHALDVLIGRVPGGTPAVPDTADGVPGFAGGPPRGTPADMLRRRPDLLVAEMGLVEAAAIVGIERSDLLPSLSISGQALLGDGSFSGIVSDFLASLAASLDLPLFDGGRRRAEVTAAEAELAARFAEYRQQVLQVMGEAENALVGIAAFEARSRELAIAVGESERAFEQSNALYREGLANLFDVLDSQRQLISSRESQIDSEAALATSIVGLYSAIGGPPGIESAGAA
ncbi:NodT family efflux transporter outer membrane factor (OMF) lipoprotein [Altererythrobacter atlanticus]|uniref:Outer membrane protein OprM n=1 Tax=Croceibacterium atlanticum TaxID=1267766 RepID=A0A0F7KUB4_9SPHN|nr:TolC family protein [Croceibacterium atlanticum]AKH42862.1 Outer membrane protein OprM precursor [Croceibacterium atlanticum]MBB5731642.1 NodT family efflux transporter outer membrane factor (OMF) lipoprotein [Croceibacterium atlanticum]